jgi:hypothetical protein
MRQRPSTGPSSRSAVLALLERKGESPPEVVVDPEMLTGIDQVGELYPQRFREGW